MSEEDRLKRFEIAFEKGKKGNILSYELWLKQYNIHSGKLTPEFLLQYFSHSTKQIINWEHEIEIIGEYLGYFTREKNDLYYIPLIGPSGIGKTLFLNIIIKMIEHLKSSINYAFFDAEKFSEEETWDNFGKSLQSSIDVLFLDNTWKDKSCENTFVRIKKQFSKGLLIASWTPETYWFHRDNNIDLTNIIEIFLEPLDLKSVEFFLKKVFEAIEIESDKKKLNSLDIFNPETLKWFHQISWGVPSVIISLLSRLLNEMFISQTTISDNKLMITVQNIVQIPSLDQIHSIPEIPKKILMEILLSPHPDGIQPLKLVEIFQLSKATISYHLNTLKDLHIVNVEKTGRATFYTIRSEIKPIIQLYISQNREYYA